jgi:signal transduction histidine kinase
MAAFASAAASRGRCLLARKKALACASCEGRPWNTRLHTPISVRWAVSKSGRPKPWERSSLSGPDALLGNDGPEGWLESEIARFVPMQPMPLNMQEVIDMVEPERMAKYLHVEVPIRVAERIRWIEAIPAWDEIPQLAEVHRWHRDTFRELRLVKRKGRRGLVDFTKVVQDAVEASEDMASKLAFAMRALNLKRGDEYDSSFVDPWMDNFLLNHIGTNFIMAQYLSLIKGSSLCADRCDFVGMIDPQCNVPEVCREIAAEIVAICGQQTKLRPVVKVEAYSACGADRGVPEFAFIPGYLKVILMEVLKNSCNATAGKCKTSAHVMKLPIHIIVCADEHRVLIRVNDRAGGIPFDVGEHVWSYFYTTNKKKPDSEYGDDATELAGYGVGLPFSRLFAKYLGGSLRLTSLPGYGTSVDITLKRVSAQQVEQVPDDDNSPSLRRGSSLDHLKLGESLTG